MKYQNFNVSLYCPVGNLTEITDFDAFDRKFSHIEKNIKLGKVYLETYRGGTIISREQMLKVKNYFLSKGLEVSGGITTDDKYDPKEGGFHSFCYTDPTTTTLMKEVVTLTAELFDEFILDDFYFTNCRCEDCIEAKGDRSWAQFRLALLQDYSEQVIIKTAKEVNPDIKVIIKYPNWYEHYQETGYNLEKEPEVFDYIYTGTETRNPMYAQQHLPKYLSYFIMRYLENVAPERNLGGWFDPYECSYNLTSYLDQGYLTLFGKAREAMLFCLGSLIDSKVTTTFTPAAGQMFEDVDRYYNKLGTPFGVPCYLPYHGSGEDYLHNYLGMCGIPFEPTPIYPSQSGTVFLTEDCLVDTDLAVKMKTSLKQGADIIVTSGFVARMGQAFHEFMNITCTDKKALINRYTYSTDGGVTFSGGAVGQVPVLIPILDFCTNDVWKIIGGYGEDNSFPILLKTTYANGRIYVLTIPDDPGNLYHYASDVITSIRKTFSKNLSVVIEGSQKLTLFLYDNDTFVLRSFLPYNEKAVIIIDRPEATCVDLEDDKIYQGTTLEGVTRVSLHLMPGVNYVFQIK